MEKLIQAIQDTIARRPNEVRAYCDLFDAARQYETENFARAHELGREIAELTREKVRQNRDDVALQGRFYELHNRALLFEAPHSFDYFMQYMEHRREPQARFWLPRRRVLEGKHRVASRIQAFIDDPDALFLGFAAPPGTGKSTLIKFLLAYIYGRYPESANMYISYSDGMVRMMYDGISAMITDPEYAFRDIFPDAAEPDLSAEYYTVSKRRRGDFPTLGLVSLGGSVTGRTRANRFQVTDDLVKNAEVARSPERLEKLYNDYRSTITTRTIGEHVKQIMLGTMWSYHDPMNRMMREHDGDPRYRFVVLPVCDETGKSNFLYDHPDRYTDAKIAELKRSLDPVDFSCLYLQRGIQKEGLAFPDDSLQYYNGVLPEGEPDNIAFYCDVAFGGGDSLSMPILYQYGGAWYLPDVVFDRSDKRVTQPRVVGKILRHRARIGRMEANNGGDAYCDEINRMLKARGYSMNLSHRKAPNSMSKLSRIEQHAPAIRDVYYLAPALQDEEYQRFMAELTAFSFTEKNPHDDAPDSLAGFCDFISGRFGTVSVVKRPI